MEDQDTVTGAEDQGDEPVVAAATDDTTVEDGPDPNQQGDGGESGGAPEDDPDEELLSREEIEALKDNPAALMKALRRSYTQKTQELGEGRRLLEALNQDPEGTLRELARLRGLELAQPDRATKTGIREKAVAALGEEVANAFLPIIEEYAQEIIEKEVGGVRQEVTKLKEDASFQASIATTKAFGAQYKDYKKYEKTMIKLSREILPGRGMSDYSYMEHLYVLAKAREGKAAATKDAIARMQTSANVSEPRPAPVSGKRVAPSYAGKTPTFEEAWAAAKRGERFEE